MASVKSVIALLGLQALGACIAIGCSSSTNGFEDPAEGGTVLPNTPKPDASRAPVKDSGTSVPTKDAEVDEEEDASVIVPPDASDDADMPDSDVMTDAGTDAAADSGALDPPGSPCATSGLVQQQACGTCGFQTRLCSKTGGNLVWQRWGFCQNEVVDGCIPGTTGTETCGLCGTRNRACQSDCHWAVGACRGEPANACKPGRVEFQPGLSCAEGGRERTCGATCQYGDFGPCKTADVPTLVLATTVNGETSADFTLAADAKIARLTGTCPNASIGTSMTSYNYITLVNPTAQAAVVQVWTGVPSTDPGADNIDTVIASYAGGTIPTTDAARKSCVKGVNDFCDDDPCDLGSAGLVGSNSVSVPANGKAVIYVAAYAGSVVGGYKLTARITSLE